MSDKPGRFTLDTNILVYSVDSASGARHERAVEIVDCAAERDCWLTLQALSEFYVAVTRKNIVPKSEAAAQISDWLTIFPTTAATADAIRTALREAVAGRASYWDALLVATAAEAGCAIILTEDLQDGSTLGSIRILNPFKGRAFSATMRDLLGLK
jgi:predicted nucleic acid-binding protein